MCGNPPGTPASRAADAAKAANPPSPPSIIDTGDSEKRARERARALRGYAATFMTSPQGVLGNPITLQVQKAMGGG